MPPEQRIKNKPLQILQHIGIWLVSFWVFLFLITKGNRIEENDVVYTLLFHLLLLPSVYVNLNYFLYRLRIRHAWYIYSFKLLLLLGMSTFVNYYFFQNLHNFFFPDYHFQSYHNWWQVSLIYFAYIAVTTLIKGTRSWFLLWKVRGELEVTEKQKAEFELQALKSQINPHFLFNTLNGIYSMSLNNDRRLPGTILQLSALMRYFLYEVKDDYVPLSKELELLDNYISLQKLRLGEEMQSHIYINGKVIDQKIAPMLLVTFLENAFKHGSKTDVTEPFLILLINVDGGELNFLLENKIEQPNNVEDRRYSGVGLNNIRRRLELLYPLKHSLEIKEQPDKFCVQLKLELI